MRILHVNKFLYRRGGAEGYMQDVADLQRAAGHEVAFFGMAHPDNDPQPYARFFPSHVEFEPPPDSPSGRALAVGRMLWSPSAQRGMAAVLDDFRPDMVHLHNVYHQLSPSILRPVARRGVPAVMTAHDYKLVCPTYQLLDNGQICEACIGGHFSQAVRRRCRDGSLATSTLAAVELTLHTRLGAYDPLDLVISPSRFLADRLRAGGLADSRVRVLPNFTDVRSTTPQRAPGAGAVFAGRLSHEKGVATLVAAIGLVEGATLDIAGDGPERASLEALAATAAPGRVTFHGRLAKDRLHDLMRGAAVSVVPSRWHENMPLAVLESFACGLPVVTTGLGGLPELVTDGVTGAVVPADDAPALAAALRPLLADPALAHRLGAEARATAERLYAPEEHLRRLMGLYAEAALRHAGPDLPRQRSGPTHATSRPSTNPGGTE